VKTNGHLLRSPESAKIKSKMLYSSSREALVQKLNGVQKEIQATDQDEIEFHNVYQQVVASATHK
jgi:cofilin